MRGRVGEVGRGQIKKKKKKKGNSLVVQWLGLHALPAKGWVSPGRGAKIPQATWGGQKQTNKKTPMLSSKHLNQNLRIKQ